MSEYKRVILNGSEESQTLVRYVRDTSGKAISMINYEDRSSTANAGQANNEARTFYFIYNGHGDVTALTDSPPPSSGQAGTVVATYSYDEFGSQLSVNGQPSTVNEQGIYNPLRYSGAHNSYYDSETSLYKMGTRYYQSDVGRWLTRDEYKGDQQEPLTQNKYTYVENNPINRTDPTGHWSAYEPKGSPVYRFTHFRMTYEMAEELGLKYKTEVANGARDQDNWSNWAGVKPWAHFDTYPGSGLKNDSRFIEYKLRAQRAGIMAKQKRFKDAWYEYGFGLHGLQDIYSHGYVNWVQHLSSKYKDKVDNPFWPGDPNFKPEDPQIETKIGWPGYPDRIRATKKTTKRYLSKFKKKIAKYM